MPSTIDPANPFVDWLLSELAARGWNTAELGRRIVKLDQVDETTADYVRRVNGQMAVLSKIVNRERAMGPEVARRIAAALDVPQSVIFRKAGLLDDSVPGGLTAGQEELLAVLDQLGEEDRETLLALAKTMKERKAKENPPAAKKPRLRPKPAQDG